MSELTDQTMHSYTHKRNEQKIKQAEQELEALLKGDDGTEEPDSNDGVQQEATEEAPKEERKASKAKEVPEEEVDEELSGEEKSFKKRYGDLRRHTQEKEQQWQTRLEKLEAQLDKATKNELVLPKTSEEIESWAKQYPDVAGIVEAIADQKATERTTDLDARLKEIEAMRTEAKRDKAEAELMKIHPDFTDIRSDDAFHEWAKDQPKVIQDALYDDEHDVKAVSRVLDLYKADNNIKTPKKSTADKGAAASVKTRGARTVVDSEDSSRMLSESMVNKMSLKEYEDRQEEIMNAMRSGKFIYDMSK